MFVKPILYKDELRLLTAFTEMSALRHLMSMAFAVDISIYAFQQHNAVDCLWSLQHLVTL